MSCGNPGRLAYIIGSRDSVFRNASPVCLDGNTRYRSEVTVGSKNKFVTVQRSCGDHRIVFPETMAITLVRLCQSVTEQLPSSSRNTWSHLSHRYCTGGGGGCVRQDGENRRPRHSEFGTPVETAVRWSRERTAAVRTPLGSRPSRLSPVDQVVSLVCGEVSNRRINSFRPLDPGCLLLGQPSPR